MLGELRAVEYAAGFKNGQKLAQSGEAG